GPGYRTGGGDAPTRRVADGTGAHIGFRPEVNGSGGSRPKERGTTSGMSRSPHGRGERTGYLVEQNASPSVGYLRLGRVRERDRQRHVTACPFRDGLSASTYGNLTRS